MGQVAQSRVGVGSGNAIGRQPQVQLEATQRLLGMGAEDGVTCTVEEPERAERLLQFQHVMTVEVGHAQVQRAVAQVVGGIHQSGPHLLGHILTRRQCRRGKEISQCGGGSVVEGASDGILGKVPDAGQAASARPRRQRRCHFF